MLSAAKITMSAALISVFLVSACAPDKPEATVNKSTTQEAKKPVIQKVEFSPTRDDVVGQWRNVSTNRSHPNTVMNRYMRHTFFDDGTVIVEDEEDSQKSGTWEFVDGRIVVSSSFKTSLFTETYEFRGRDKIEKTRFQSVVDGNPMADYDPDESYIRQGSDRERNMKVWDVFAEVAEMLDFVDPNTLEVGKTYTLSKNTPLMPSYAPASGSVDAVMSQLQDAQVIQSGGAIQVLERKELDYQIWYQVQAGGHTGWVKSTALFGQDLKEK